MKNGRRIPVKEMSDRHLFNSLRLINRRLQERGKVPDLWDQDDDEDGMDIKLLYKKMSMLEDEKVRREKEGAIKANKSTEGAKNSTKGVGSNKRKKEVHGYYVAKHGKNGLEYLVDRNKTRSKWWTKDLNEAMCFHKQRAAYYQRQKLRFGKIEVIKGENVI